MAVSFDHGHYTKIKVFAAVIVLLCIHVDPGNCRRRKHPPVQAFFQGDCSHKICEQTCRDIDNGGYACGCLEGYTLDHNGISCSKITKDHLYENTKWDADAPVEIKIVPLDVISNKNNIQINVKPHISQPYEDSDSRPKDLTFKSSDINRHPAASHNQYLKYSNDKDTNSKYLNNKFYQNNKYTNDKARPRDDNPNKYSRDDPNNKKSTYSATHGDYHKTLLNNKQELAPYNVNVVPLEGENTKDVSERPANNPNAAYKSRTHENNVVLGRGDSDGNSTSGTSIKIVSIDDHPDAPALETDDLRNSETRQTENLQNLVPNPIPKRPDLHNSRDNEGSNSESGGSVNDNKGSVSNKGETKALEICDEFSCLNDGKCVDDGTALRKKVRCDCPLGTHGDRCENEANVRFPRFYGNSFLALPVLKDGYKELDILIEFKPSTPSGLLFFSSEFEDARSDFFSIALVEGFVEVRYDCGTGMGVVRSSSTVTMDTWNTVKVHRVNNTSTMWVNQDQPVQGQSQGSYTRLTLRLNLYLGGYDNLVGVKGRVGTDKGLDGCIEEVIINGFKYDLRQEGLVGNAQFGVNIGECSHGLCEGVSCENYGQCKVTSADTHICLCPLGTGGENCQHVMKVHIPDFQGHSFLELKGLAQSSLLFLEIELVIKPSQLDGLILYNGHSHDRKGDFISLALHGGFLEYRFDLGTGPAIIRSKKQVTINQWYWVKLSRTGMEGIMHINNEVTAIGQSQGAFTQLSVGLNMYIGGHRNFDETSKQANVSRSFEGCIQKLIINNRHIHLMNEALYGVNIDNCQHPCIGEPCLNGGECLPRRDVYACSCHLGYKGHNCQKKINKDIDTPMFSSESYLKFTQKDISKRVGGDKIDIRVAIKPDPTSRDGLFFWSGPDVMEPTSDYIALAFKAGALQFRYNLGSGEAVISYNNTSLFNGMWHYIHAQRDKQDGYLSIDKETIVEGNSKGSYTMLNTNKILYIGGMPDIQRATIRKFSSGFRGCLKDLVLGGLRYSSSILTSADSGRNVLPCS